MSDYDQNDDDEIESASSEQPTELLAVTVAYLIWLLPGEVLDPPCLAILLLLAHTPHSSSAPAPLIARGI